MRMNQRKGNNLVIKTVVRQRLESRTRGTLYRRQICTDYQEIKIKRGETERETKRVDIEIRAALLLNSHLGTPPELI